MEARMMLWDKLIPLRSETNVFPSRAEATVCNSYVYLFSVPRGQDEELDSLPALRRKLQRVQVSNLNLTRGLERAERMLKAQVSVSVFTSSS